MLVSVCAGALRPHAVLARAGKEMLLEPKIDQRVQPAHGLGPDIAATTAIAAVRAAIFDEFLAPERDAARAAPAGANIYLCQV